MSALGHWMERRVEATWIQGTAETGALYIEGFLAPFAREYAQTGALSPTRRDAVYRMVVDGSLASRVKIIKLWRLDGTLLHASNGARLEHSPPLGEISRAASGSVVVDVEEAGADGDHEAGGRPLIEIYAPLSASLNGSDGTGGKSVVLVGEFYESGVMLDESLRHARLATWGVVGFVASLMMGLIYLIVRQADRTIEAQRTELQSKYHEANALARKNDALRRMADKARLDATVSNENFLGRIGSDLHDGPVQLLSLLMLRLGETGTSATDDPRHLVRQILEELRNLSAGLVLPEIDDLSLAEAISLAVERHCDLTGTHVDAAIEPLPRKVSKAIRVCAYRIVQEALNNAYRHAGGRDQRVIAGVRDREIRIVVSDGGGGVGSAVDDTGRVRLGLSGLKNRVQSLGGAVGVHVREGGGCEVRAVLPIRQRDIVVKPST